ncbi:hypothetical protein [Haliangium sp. UPWRP_2]|uniref:hypothetical protein n=1 Tax=Haliangium sp. UPWRP_2 TaxID=1931276 RepID=UPI000B54665D|nr:hypothetical protein [Haliangium sp. UPWRP_2]PSM31434.1 hypothetical protein BVG81_005440 [Haliangium sp. UPWRP_2]
MNRLASKLPKNKPPRIVAKLDLSDDMQRQLHAFFQRMHTGRWPKLRALAVRQMPDGTIVEAAEWLRQAGDRFALIEWAVVGPRLSWSCETMASRASAIAHLRAR